MANRVLRYASTTTSQRTFENLEKWRDLDKIAIDNYNHQNIPEVYLSDYVRFLKTEHKLDRLPESQLSNILAENQTINVEDPYTVVSAIAVSISCGYDQAIDTYEKFMEPYKYRLGKLVNVKAVQNSIHNIFTWIPGERILNPEFGSRLKKYLYEGITPLTEEQVNAEIRKCITQWEPRANILSIINVGDVNDTEDNTIHLDVVFNIPELSEQQYRYSYFYKRGDVID